MKTIKELLKEIPLEARIETYLMMDDYENWDNGKYKGDRKALMYKTKCLVAECKQWIKDGMPEKKQAKS